MILKGVRVAARILNAVCPIQRWRGIVEQYPRFCNDGKAVRRIFHGRNELFVPVSGFPTKVG